MYRFAFVPALLSLFFMSQSTTHACGSKSLSIVKAMSSADKPPLAQCGSDFNLTLQRAHKKDWAGALEAYQAHLKGIFGRSNAGTADAKATLQYLSRMARDK
jgi:hypothetical protein